MRPNNLSNVNISPVIIRYSTDCQQFHDSYHLQVYWRHVVIIGSTHPRWSRDDSFGKKKNNNSQGCWIAVTRWWKGVWLIFPSFQCTVDCLSTSPEIDRPSTALDLWKVTFGTAMDILRGCLPTQNLHCHRRKLGENIGALSGGTKKGWHREGQWCIAKIEMRRLGQ